MYRDPSPIHVQSFRWERPRGLAATADDGALNEPTGREVVNVIKVRSVASVLISRRPRRPVRWSVLALTAALAPGALLPLPHALAQTKGAPPPKSPPPAKTAPAQSGGTDQNASLEYQPKAGYDAP